MSDVQAARLASIHSIGYANQPGKRERFTQVGAEAGAIIDSLADLALRLRARVANPELLQLSPRAFFKASCSPDDPTIRSYSAGPDSGW